SVVAAALMMLLVGCDTNNKTTSTTTTSTAENNKVAVNDGHNAYNSLDYEGVYQGDVILDSNERAKVTLQLSADHYKRTVSFLDAGSKKVNVEEMGAYHWSE